jgi:membrane protease YdiL (CAAX protease family)
VTLPGWLKALGLAIAWVLAFLVVGIAVTLLVSRLSPETESSWWLARAGAIGVVAFGAATWAVGRGLNHCSWQDLGWKDGRASRMFAEGVAWGAAMAALAVGLAMVAGGARAYLWRHGVGVLPAGGPLLLGVLLAALAEELAFRGYPLRRLAQVLGSRGAAALSAFAFGAAHLANPEATPFGVVNIALAGVWLSLAFFSPGGMPLAWGVHFGWNAALAELFHAPVSGYTFPGPGGLHYIPGRYPWLDGGRFGPEGGLVGTIAIAAGIALLWRRHRALPRPAT